MNPLKDISVVLLCLIVIAVCHVIVGSLLGTSYLLVRIGFDMALAFWRLLFF